jgi:hypothetical protein
MGLLRYDGINSPKVWILNKLHTHIGAVKLLFPAVLLVSLMVSCKDSTPDTVDCAGLTPTYTSDIKAILDASCAKSGCHNANDLANNYDFSQYATAAPISQGDRFLGAIQHKGGFSAMPQGQAKLSQDKIDLLTCWVQNGSPE